MSIRNYQGSDWREVVNIYNLAKADEFIGAQTAIEVLPLEQDNEMLELFNASDIYVYEDKYIKGFAGHKGTYISWLFVHPEYRRLKIAYKLITHILNKLQGRITLNVAATNVAALNLYAEFGFFVSNEFDGKYQGITVNVLRLELENG